MNRTAPIENVTGRDLIREYLCRGVATAADQVNRNGFAAHEQYMDVLTIIVEN